MEGSSLDEVTIGDLIVLKAKSLNTSEGFLRGDSAGLNLGVQLPLIHEIGVRDSLEYEDYVFRVCPALTYRQKNELESISGRSSATLKRQRSIGSLEAAAAALSVLESRVEAEEASNAMILSQVQRGIYTGANLTGNDTVIPVVRYGEAVMLQHVKSGCFLTALESAAPCDSECRAVKLVNRDAAAALFKLMPRFKAQTEGSIVFYSHTLKIESAKMSGMLLHASLQSRYSDIPDPTNPLLPKCLQTGVSLEVNLSPEATSFAIINYGRYGVEDVGLLRTGDPFRLYHSQTESFMHASCDAEKDRRYPEGRADELPAHIPYLKKLPDLGDTPDPTDPEYHYPKGVWRFEMRNRRTCGVVSWDTVYRLRHIPSGRYLAVDTTLPMREEETAEMSEAWYRTFLVDDASLPGEEVGVFDAEGRDIGFKAVPEQSLEFVALSADVSRGNKIPFADVNLRISHMFDGVPLFLHCSDERKPSKLRPFNAEDATMSVIAKTLGLVFSTVKSAQDIFKALPISREEKKYIESACAFRAPLAIYAESMSHPEIKIKPDLAQDTIQLLLQILETLIVGTYVFSHSEDWISKANSMLPVPFSALFKGERDRMAQRISRDVKLMDYVFVAGNAHYARFSPSHPWTSGEGGTLASEMIGPQAVQKFIYVTLQRICLENQESQEYVGSRYMVPLTNSLKLTHGEKSISWMEVILSSLDDPLGSAVTLSQLLNQNEKLMRKYATPAIVNRFLEMIRTIGPQPRLVNFFASICSVGSNPVKANQEMVLRLTWMHLDWRAKVYVHTESFEAKQCRPPLAPFSPLFDAYGNPSEHWGPDAATIKTFPPAYIGKIEFEKPGCFSPVFVKWTSLDVWQKGCDELYWSPESLNIPTYTISGEQWVRIEDFCWVLEPERLCKAVTGREWSDVLEEEEMTELNPKSLRTKPGAMLTTLRFKHQNQFALYYASQLSMFSRLCYGRSYNCITWMEKSLPYPMLAYMSFSPHLPSTIRAMAVDLINALYLDRFPQMIAFGRPMLPEQLWIHELNDKSLGSNPNVPVIKPRGFVDNDALPAFSLSPKHHFASHPNPFLSFPLHTKFFVLRYLGNAYMKTFENGSMAHSHKFQNELTNTVVSMVADLTKFGFQSSHDKIKGLLSSLVSLLDGRTDIASLDLEFGALPFSPPSARYSTSPLSGEVTALKARIISVLLDFSDLRANFRLGNFLQKIKEYGMDSKQCNELKKIHAFVEHDVADQYEGDFPIRLFNDFEDLFENGDGGSFTFDKLSGGQPVDLILVDCLMYEDDKLFAKALELLERIYMQRAQLMGSLKDVVILQNESVPVFGNCADMVSEIFFLKYLVRSSEVWGVSSKVSGKFEADKLDIILDTCHKLEQFMKCTELSTLGRSASSIGSKNALLRGTSTKPISEEAISAHLRQDMLRSLGLQSSLLDCLKMDYNISFKGSICSAAEMLKSRDLLITAQRRLINLVIMFVKGNAKNQKIVFEYLPHLRKHCGPLKLPRVFPSDFTEEHKLQLETQGMNCEGVIVECLRNNMQLCQEDIPRDLLEEFGVLVDSSTDPTTSPYLELFSIACQPCGKEGKALHRNQDLVLEVLLSDSLAKFPRYIHDIFFGDTEALSTCGYRPQSIIELFSSTICEGNIRTASKLQAHRITVDATVKAMYRVFNASPTADVVVQPTSRKQEGASWLTTLFDPEVDVPDTISQATVETDKLIHPSSTDKLYREKNAESPLFTALLEFLSLQLDVLVMDPKLFRMKSTWELVSVGVASIVTRVEKDIEAHQLSTNLANAGKAACKVAGKFLESAMLLGIRDTEGTGTKAGLSAHHENLLFNSALKIASMSTSDIRRSLLAAHTVKNQAIETVFEMDSLKSAAVKLCNVMEPTLHLMDDEEAKEAAQIKAEEEETARQQEAHHQDGFNMPLGIELRPLEFGAITDLVGHNAEVVSPQMKAALEYYERLKHSFEASSPQDILEYVSQALAVNTMLNNKLNARHFSLVTLLENVESFTGDKGVDSQFPGADGLGSVGITWGSLVGRMVKYVNQHNHDRDEQNSLRVLRVLRSHLSKACSEADGTPLDMWDLSESRREAYVDKQTSYVEFGVAGLCFKAIASHPSNVEGNLADEGVEMLLQMSMGGNPHVQAALIDFIHDEDRDNKFAWHMKGRLDHALMSIKDRKDRCEISFSPITTPLKHEYKNGVETFNMLQQLCEGHNFNVQNILREQAGHTASVDLIASAAQILIVLCDSSRALLMMEDADVELLEALLGFLTDAIQCPCPKNQELLVMLDGVTAAVDKILQSIFSARVSTETQLHVKATASLFLAALLEGRFDMIIHKKLAEDLGPELFDMLRLSVTKTLTKAGKQPETDQKQLKMIALELLSSVSTIINELRKVDAFAEKMDAKPRKKSEKADLMEQEVRVIEVLWRNRIECTSFSIPQDSAFLSIKTREEFLKNADLSTSEKRMKQLLGAAPVFMAEMEQIHALSKTSPLYAFINHNIVNIKWSMYALVVLLNLNIVMASYGKGSADGYVSISDAVLNGNVQNKYVNSLNISIVLAVFNLMGYVVIVTFLAITEVPIIIKELDDYVAACVGRVTMKEDEYRDPGAFTWWFVTLIFNVVFIIQHSANYPDNPNPDLYSFLVFGINMPWTLSCVRNYIVVPNTHQTRLFCVVYDVLVTKPFFRNHVLLMICSINGFGASYYFPLMLMDILNNSHVIANIARSVTDNGVELGWVLYLFVITIVIYAQFGLEFFEEWFTYDGDADDEEAKGCHSVVSCFVLIFYHGAPGGTLDDVFDPISNRVQPTYLKRVMFDLSFFVWVGVLLFNIITGLMVDGFGALREEDNERKNILENSCFVCGFTRESYDDIPNFQGPAFDWHKTEEHHFWSYVDFYVYLKRKNKADLTGVESYVWEMIQTSNFVWIPVHNSASLQEARDEFEDASDLDHDDDSPLTKSIAKEISAMKTTLDSVESRTKSGAVKEAAVVKWDIAGASLPLPVFLSGGGLERFAPVFVSKGFSDPASLGDLSSFTDHTLEHEYNMDRSEIRRLKALVELRDVNPVPSRAFGSSRQSFNNKRSNSAPSLSWKS